MPRDFLVTYDPAYLEEHTDSSEFEESITSLAPKNSNQYLLVKEKVTKNQKEILNRKISNRIFANNGYNKKHEYNNTSRLEEKVAQTGNILNHGNISKNVANKHKHLNQGDPSNYKLKKSLIRHKVIPCLSNMFERSISKLAPKETQLKNISKDNCCQMQCMNGDRRRRNKLNREQKYTVEPMYALEIITRDPKHLDITENTNSLPHDHNKSLRRVYSNIICNVTLSEDESEELEKLKRKKYKKKLRAEIKQAHLKYGHSNKNYEQQFPSKHSIYQVFATNQGPYNATMSQTRKDNNPLQSESSLASSGLWDYILEKFNKKYPAKGSVKQYQYKDFAVQCCPVSSENNGPNIELKHHRRNCNSYPDDECPCSELFLRYVRNAVKDFNNNFDSSQGQERKKASVSKQVQCECPPERQPIRRRQTMPAKQYSPASIDENPCSCQRPHDQITEALADKYHGEVLCIHNPPCILINGCLNVTRPQEVAAVSAWPVIESKKDSFLRGYKKKNSKQKREQFSQNHAQSVELRQCKIPQPKQHKNEKVVQSLCSHNPPCEVIRCCYKQKFDPSLQNSCVHVPMCQKVPECRMQHFRENQTVGACRHKPKCAEVPVCTRKCVTLTARDSIGTQVKPQTNMLCRHDPPCVLIPKCLGRASHETYISYEAIPICVHQPLCDLIPACCRKSTKGMVSTSSQYPNGCRVV